MRMVMLDWSFEPWVVASVTIGAAWYCVGLWRLSRRTAIDRVATRGEVAAFAGGMLTLVLALMSPIAVIAEQLFSMHMVQHLLLMLVAAPLIAWSRPVLVFLWALPPFGRKGMGRAWTGGLRNTVRILMHPAAVWLLFNGSFVFWH